jgi:hypothetical protein
LATTTKRPSVRGWYLISVAWHNCAGIACIETIVEGIDDCLLRCYHLLLWTMLVGVIGRPTGSGQGLEGCAGTVDRSVDSASSRTWSGRNASSLQRCNVGILPSARRWALRAAAHQNNGVVPTGRRRCRSATSVGPRWRRAQEDNGQLPRLLFLAAMTHEHATALCLSWTPAWEKHRGRLAPTLDEAAAVQAWAGQGQGQGEDFRARIGKETLPTQPMARRACTATPQHGAHWRSG